jgi:acyl-CoA-binding protein
MKSSKDIDQQFLEAVERVNRHVEPFPADFLLRLYAFYKRATNNDSSPNSKNNLINAFKTNALFQARDVDTNAAKANYVELVNAYFKPKVQR